MLKVLFTEFTKILPTVDNIVTVHYKPFFHTLNARLHPALAYSLMQGKPVDPQICVWSVQGEAALGALTQNAAKPFELTIWMAASATERSMEYNVLRIQGF